MILFTLIYVYKIDVRCEWCMTPNPHTYNNVTQLGPQKRPCEEFMLITQSIF
jgi:hypothetical protein